MKRLLNFAMFYVGWFACVLGAARGHSWLGPAVVATLLAVHLAPTAHRAEELRLVVAVGLFGFLLDTLQGAAGLYAFKHGGAAPWLCPPWMVALWMIFATTLNSSMGWLAGRYRLAAAIGALCGPVSYAAGARLGAIDLRADALVSLIGISLAWAVAMPALLMMRDALSRPAARLELRRATHAF